MLRSVKYHVEAGHDKVYLYEYSFIDEDTPYVPHTNVRGVTHCGQSTAVTGGYPGYRDPNNTRVFGDVFHHENNMGQFH